MILWSGSIDAIDVAGISLDDCWVWTSADTYGLDYQEVLQQPINLDAVGGLQGLRFLPAITSVLVTIRRGNQPTDPLAWLGTVLTEPDPEVDPSTPSGGTVTSVQVSAPALMRSTGGPITTSGEIQLAWDETNDPDLVLADGTTLPRGTYVIADDQELHYAGVADATPPTLTHLGGTSVHITACNVNLYQNQLFVGGCRPYAVPEATLTLASNVSQFLCVGWNSGSPEYYIESDDTAINGSDIIAVYAMWLAPTGAGGSQELHSVSFDSRGLGLSNKVADMLTRTSPYSIAHAQQLTLGETATPVVRTVTIAEAVVFAGIDAVNVSPLNSSVAGNRLTLVSHAGGVWTYTDTAQYNNTDYDNGTDLVPMGANRYGVRWYYRSIGDDIQAFYLCTGNYANVGDARAEPIPTGLPVIMQDHCLLVGRMIVQQGGNTALSIDQVASTTFASSNVNIHNNLNGLQGSGPDYYHLTAAQYSALLAGYLPLAGGIMAPDAQVVFSNSPGNTHMDPSISITRPYNASQAQDAGIYVDTHNGYAIRIKNNSDNFYAGATITNYSAQYALELLLGGSGTKSLYAAGWVTLDGYVSANYAGTAISAPNGQISALGYRTPTGLSTEFLKADGSVDSTVYLTAASSTLQIAYNASTAGATTPQILTSTAKGALYIRRGSAADTDNVFVIENGSGSDQFLVTGNGDVTARRLVLTKDSPTYTDLASLELASSTPRIRLFDTSAGGTNQQGWEITCAGTYLSWDSLTDAGDVAGVMLAATKAPDGRLASVAIGGSGYLNGGLLIDNATGICHVLMGYATQFGTSAQFLKADGSLDSTAYAPAFGSGAAGLVWATPAATAGVPSLRALAASDIPTLNQNTTGSAAKWTTARTLTIGATGKAVDGSSNVSWSLAEIGAASASSLANYLPLAGGTMTGSATFSGAAAGAVFTGYGASGIYNGNADNATYSAYNLKIKSWWGIGFESYDGVTRTILDTRSGNFSTLGNLACAGAVAWGGGILRDYVGDTNYTAMYGSGVDAAGNNYTLAFTKNGQVTWLGGTVSSGLVAAGKVIAQATSAGLAVTGELSASKRITANIAQMSAWSPSDDYARFGHYSWNTAAGFGYIQHSSGEVYLEAPINQKIHLRVSGSDILKAEAGSVTVYGNLGVSGSVGWAGGPAIASSDYVVQGNGSGALGHRTTRISGATATPTQSGFYDAQSPADGPQGAVWTHMIRNTHTSGGSSAAYQWMFDLAATFGGGAATEGVEGYYVRTISAGSTPGWRQLWHSGNLNIRDLVTAPTITAIYGSNIASPGYTNYSFSMSKDGAIAYVNGSSYSGLLVGATAIALANSAGLSVTGDLSATGTITATNASFGGATATSFLRCGSDSTQVPMHRYTTSSTLPVMGLNTWRFITCDDTSPSTFYWSTNGTQSVRWTSGASQQNTPANSGSFGPPCNYRTWILYGPTVAGSNTCTLIVA